MKKNKQNDNDPKNINIDSFSITAYNLQLFIDAELKIKYGQRYGLIGRNGIGKTTLVKYITAKKLAISEKLDIFAVDQETKASETSVFETVLSAHQERLDLIKRGKELQIVLDEDATDDVLEEYNQIEEKTC